PLDDANVERFCNLVDEMTRMTDTRFLVITHHPLTMARMDRLYGVTMAERGVSQLVTVDLDQAAEVVRAAGGQISPPGPSGRGPGAGRQGRTFCPARAARCAPPCKGARRRARGPRHGRRTCLSLGSDPRKRRRDRGLGAAGRAAR